MLSRFLYEKSVVHQGYLIIPFVHQQIEAAPIYSYRLLSMMGRQGLFHQTENPTQTYAGQLAKIIAIAQEYLDRHSDIDAHPDYFQQRYVYLDNLILISAIAGKYFYDHYSPTKLENIAAPRIFASEAACITWVKQGLDRQRLKFAP